MRIVGSNLRKPSLSLSSSVDAVLITCTSDLQKKTDQRPKRIQLFTHFMVGLARENHHVGSKLKRVSQSFCGVCFPSRASNINPSFISILEKDGH